MPAPLGGISLMQSNDALANGEQLPNSKYSSHPKSLAKHRFPVVFDNDAQCPELQMSIRTVGGGDFLILEVILDLVYMMTESISFYKKVALKNNVYKSYFKYKHTVEF